MITIILHNFKDLDLISSKTASIAIDQIPEEINQLAFIVILIRLVFNILAYHLNQIEDSNLIVKHCLVVIVHLLKEINATYVMLDVVDHFGNKYLDLRFYLVEVLDQSYDEIITHV